MSRKRVPIHRFLPVALGLAFLLLLAWQAQSLAFPQPSRPTPTPAFPAAPEAAGPADDLPDLTVRAIQVEPLHPLVGITATVRVLIANIGEKDVAPPTTSSWTSTLTRQSPQGQVSRGRQGPSTRGSRAST